MKKLMMLVVAACAIQAQAVWIGMSNAPEASGGYRSSDVQAGYYVAFSLSKSDGEKWANGSTAAYNLAQAISKQELTDGQWSENVKTLLQVAQANVVHAQKGEALEMATIYQMANGDKTRSNVTVTPHALSFEPTGWDAKAGKYIEGDSMLKVGDGNASSYANNHYMVVFYDDGEDAEFRVVSFKTKSGSSEYYTGTLNEGMTASGGAEKVGASAWLTGASISVPEPTTGILVLLGMAGLVLKRKHA